MDFITIIKYAWLAYDSSRSIDKVEDISARVSTNHVYRVTFADKSFVIAKLSNFGVYEHFVEDHNIIHVLGNNLQEPFQNFLARSLIKDQQLYVHRFKNESTDTWVVFYLPIRIKHKLPKRLDEDHIIKIAREFANFHKQCSIVRHTLPKSTKTLSMDISKFERILEDPRENTEFLEHKDVLLRHCEAFKESRLKNNFDRLEKIPVFVDWNIGNFSVSAGFKLFSRWDYDWFRVSTRMMDFYFFSRIVSNVGDRSAFSYNIETMLEPRFLLFLKHYHAVYPLLDTEIRCLKETYRFFILNYVLKNGKYFFLPHFKEKLQKDVYDIHLDSIDKFDPEILIKALNI